MVFSGHIILARLVPRRIKVPKLSKAPSYGRDGHTSLLFLTGMLGGYVPSSPPHVVRGLNSKIEKLHCAECFERPGVDAVTKEIFFESPIPIVRAAWSDGIIRTFSDQVGEEDRLISI